MMINTQPIEKLVIDPVNVDIVGMFPTIQGEGPHIGRPAVFVRFAGCSILCPGCDTDYTTNRITWPVDSLAQSIREECAKRRITLVVITGGEPFRQTSLANLSLMLVGLLDVQIETNGTLWNPALPGKVVVVCSPKTGKIAEGLVQRMIRHPLDSFKYVMDANHVDEFDGLPTSVLGRSVIPARPPAGFPSTRVYLQPADEQDEEKNKRNREAVVQSCLKYGYRLCLQIHKTAGLP